MRRTIHGWRAVAVALLVVATSACGSRQTPLGELGPEELWTRGVAEYNEEDWDEAVRYFDRYTLVGGSDPRVYQARYYVAQAHFNQGEYITAATDFARLGGDLGRLELADDARFMACRAYEELSPHPQLDQEYTRGAIEHCQALLEYFPDSEFAERASSIIDDMIGKLAEKLYESADWYLSRRAYDSALIYFEDVVAQYPNTRWAPRALGKMIEIYETLEYDDEREETVQRLLRAYPESEAAREHGG